MMMAGAPVRLRVAGISMLPTLWPGDWVSLLPARAADLRPGDVIAFTRDGRVIVHRVVSQAQGATGPAWITRGDGQNHADLPMLPAELLGIVTSFRRFGRLGADRPIAGSPSCAARAFAAAVGRSSLARFLLLRIYSRLPAWIFAAQNPRSARWLKPWRSRSILASPRGRIGCPADKPVVVE
jgi:hypothetical protein